MLKTFRKYLSVYTEILAIYFTGYLDEKFKEENDSFHFTVIAKKILISVWWIMRDLFNPIRTLFVKGQIEEISPKNKTWIFISSKNHFDSIGFLKSKLDDAIIVVPHIRQVDFSDYIFPYYFKILYYIKVPVLWFNFLIHYRKFALKHFDLLMEATGVYEISRKLLLKNRPKAIIFANDHIIKHRALLVAAMELKIKTFYLQHASITAYFPPLIFDYALLEGQDSLNKYKKCGEVKSQVFFVGMPKYDDYKNSYRDKKRKNIETIGIATNSMDDNVTVIQLIDEILKAFPHVKIIFRPHPLDNRKIKFSNPNFMISNSKKEKTFDFLIGLDLLISGNSSIHLEAALVNCPSLMYGFNKNNTYKDSYDYVKNNLAHKADNEKDVIQLIGMNNLAVQSEVVKYYNDVIDTKWEGRSQTLIEQIINKCLNQK